MAGIFEQSLGYGVRRLSGALGGLADSLRAVATERIEQLSAAWRAEVQRLAMTFALALTLAFFVCAAAAFAMFALMLSFWETHRVLAAWLVTGGFIVLAWLAAILLRSSTLPDVSKDD